MSVVIPSLGEAVPVGVLSLKANDCYLLGPAHKVIDTYHTLVHSLFKQACAAT